MNNNNCLIIGGNDISCFTSNAITQDNAFEEALNLISSLIGNGVTEFYLMNENNFTKELLKVLFTIKQSVRITVSLIVESSMDIDSLHTSYNVDNIIPLDLNNNTQLLKYIKNNFSIVILNDTYEYPKLHKEDFNKSGINVLEL